MPPQHQSTDYREVNLCGWLAWDLKAVKQKARHSTLPNGLSSGGIPLLQLHHHHISYSHSLMCFHPHRLAPSISCTCTHRARLHNASSAHAWSLTYSHTHCSKYQPRQSERWRGREGKRKREKEGERQGGGSGSPGGKGEKTRERENTQLGQSYVIPLILMHACTKKHSLIHTSCSIRHRLTHIHIL